MQTLIYTYSEKEVPLKNGHTHKTVRIYRIKQNKPIFLTERTDTYVDEFQLVMEALQACKGLPKKAFAVYEQTGSMIYHLPYRLREDGIADIYRIS